MDVKATALLKLIYLEMFGFDMTWAAFNVLEVMSSVKHMQKRVGYLAAVQTFRPDTEVLMLAENLLKKDLTSPLIPTLSLPLSTLPHIITSSLALSILTDILPRLTHSQPAVRKKTITTLYRLALVYPETLRVAWPKIKERLLDENEDASVTAATINVVCELGWRRPSDFLPLAPRLFELLIEGGNNWMAIKIIKLFAVLTPLEPRLVKKLVRPLTNLIQSTTAMSLLYECVSGIVQGGILDSVDSGIDVEEVADLCISKLRGMIILDGDPNLRYVALVAFNKIITTHANLVAVQQDVIFRCLDDPDVSIRLQALELATGMVNSDNLQNVVDMLLKQLTSTSNAGLHSNGALTEEDDTDLEQKLKPDKRGSEVTPVSSEYREEMIDRILKMCSNDTYANVTDFEWYTGVLLNLIGQLPAASAGSSLKGVNKSTELSTQIGAQLLDLAVRVKDIRPEVVKLVEDLLIMDTRHRLFSTHGAGQNQILDSAAWVAGEYPIYLSRPYEVINSLVHEDTHKFIPTTIATMIQAMAKILASMTIQANKDWNVSRKATMDLTLSRILAFWERLSSHPNLDVQERSVEFLELLKLGSEALLNLPLDASEAPLLLIHALPDLFAGVEFGPVSAAAQKKVPLPEQLDLDAPLNSNLALILQTSQVDDTEDDYDEEFGTFDKFYNERTTAVGSTPQAPKTLYRNNSENDNVVSYQSLPESPQTKARRKAERAERNRDDPFYIPSAQDEPLIQQEGELDVDSIPIVDLAIDTNQLSNKARPEKLRKKPKKRFAVAADETLDVSDGQLSTSYSESRAPRSALRGLSRPASSSSLPASQTRKNPLSIDSSTLGSFSMKDQEDSGVSQLEIERRLAEEAEMAAAVKEIERKRLELQRNVEQANTQVAEGVDQDGVVVKRKKKKKSSKVPDNDGDVDLSQGNIVKKKKRKKVKPEAQESASAEIDTNE